ncbi:hypothetical protein JKP88DRAFT_254403 [Tribonema minus]|uniref:Uncharacterized protein n=1 Tax=Tribonema minus TaxID=303371 RepID=A0A835Z4J5_9STRA|nr:hypothetical protein JKP88DRAFT_254403 [Tribonema minus]
MEVERIRVPAPASSLSQQEIVRMVFTSMAGRRLLPKECWSLSSLLHDTVAPTIEVHPVADSADSAVLHRLLEDTSRRRIRCLTLDGDFTSIQQRPLSLPPSLERLELNGFRGELGAAPSGLRELHLYAGFDRGEDIVPHPLLAELYDSALDSPDDSAIGSEAAWEFVGEMAEIVKAFLPTLRVLVVCGLSQMVSLQALMTKLVETPLPRLQVLSLHNWAVPWEDLLLLLSPVLAKVKLENCLILVLYADIDTPKYTVPALPEGLVSLDLDLCFSHVDLWVFGGLPESLRHLVVVMEGISVRFEAPLPTLLESFRAETLGSGIHIDMGLLPAGLRKLKLAGAEQQPLDRVPAGLRVLMLRNYRHPLPQLPDTLVVLVVHECMHHAVDLPDSLRSLSLYWRPAFPTPPLPARWPVHLQRLVYCGESHQSPVPGIEHLPPTLGQLTLNGCEVRTSLPQMLEELCLGRQFTQAIDLDNFRGRVLRDCDAFRSDYDLWC